ncbi:hypothetical protein L1987_61364 [Smallanthus sonchifolius]|uniref:Uncharacterized protein n=1 Tax=Smallanthus sonchifolius TaxID=185202 RepID=A0ACB9DB08_9ASTR|nr:hypothetical protein L1987_61364 [Smallanthus sonchifolius]
MIRGKKNFLPPHPLIMGFGILFRLDETSLGSHLNERRVRGEDEGLNESEDTEPFKELSDSCSENEAPNAEYPVNASDLATDDQKLANLSSEADSNHEISSDSRQISVEEETSVPPELEDLLDRALELGSAAKKYGLLASSQADSDVNNEEKKETVSREKPYISKAERRKLKKGPTHSEGRHVIEYVEKKKYKVEEKNVEVDGGGKISRGQKGKLKKMKEKYRDQDEEERKIRMALLASAGKAKSNDQEAQSEATPTSKELEPVGSGNEDATKRCYKCKKVGHLAKDCQEDSNGIDRVNEAERMAMEEDDIKEIGEDEKEKLNEVDYLTGVPLPNDILLYAVPVCAPYAAIQSYKYRVKIIPGTAKKGKAAKMAMNLFGHVAEASQREKELMKACTDPELMAAIIGNVKISAAGLTQLKQKQKKGKKAASKQT